MPPRKGWAAVYCRLSKEDEEKAAGLGCGARLPHL